MIKNDMALISIELLSSVASAVSSDISHTHFLNHDRNKKKDTLRNDSVGNSNNGDTYLRTSIRISARNNIGERANGRRQHKLKTTFLVSE
jgi:hypothetical protein